MSIIKINLSESDFNRIVRVTFRNDGGCSDYLGPLTLLKELKKNPYSVRLIHGKFYMEFKIRSWMIEIDHIRIAWGEIIDYNKGSVIVDSEAINIKPKNMQPSNTPEMKFKSVKLINGGLKGLKADYSVPHKTGRGIVYIDKESPEKNRPIPFSLEEPFIKLKPYLLDICSYTIEEEERKYLMQHLNMVSVKKDKGEISLGGVLAITDGSKFLKLEPDAIDESYPEYQTISAIVTQIFNETKEYLQGDKAMEDIDIVAKYNKEITKDELLKMPKTKLKELATQALEDMGCIVIHQEDMVAEQAVDTTPQPAFSEGTKTEELKFDEPVKKVKKEKLVATTTEAKEEPAVQTTTAETPLPEMSVDTSPEKDPFGNPIEEPFSSPIETSAKEEAPEISGPVIKDKTSFSLKGKRKQG